MAGFDNEIVYGTNVDFRGVSPVVGQVDSDGQLLIGAFSAPFIRVGSLTSLDGSLVISNGPGTIDIEVDGGETVGKTLTGNTGGARPPSAGNWNIVTDNTTATFVGSGSTLTLDYNLSNILIGNEGPAITSGFSNIGIGASALISITSGGANVAIGDTAADSLNTGANNVIVGVNAGGALTNATQCVAVGTGALAASTAGSGNRNVAVGYLALGNVTTGTANIGIGTSAGGNYTGAEASNICISNAGTLGESHIIRIGTQGSSGGEQTDCYLAGVLHTTSGRTVNVTTPGAYPYTALTTDYLIKIDTSSARTINLLASPETGREYIVKDTVGSAAANNITVSGNGKNIDGAASYTMNINYASITVVYNGSEWSVV